MIRPDVTSVTPVLPRHFVQAALLMLIDESPAGAGEASENAYGYHLRDQLAAMGAEQQDYGQLYRTLRGMEKTGLVLSCWENSEAGPARRTYHVTEKGRLQLSAWAEGMAVGRHLVEAFLRRYDDECDRSPAVESA